MSGTQVSSAVRERAAIVRLTTRSDRDLDPAVALDELDGLARAAGADVVLRVAQDRDTIDPATLIGRGKAELLAAAAAETGIDLVIFDNDLSPAQARNLEEIVRCRVIDRTALILDIFASRARTREGQLQVELAQLEYMLPRLAGSGAALSRLGGGIGTRGPGETKLETDRRRIRRRIAALGQQIANVRRRREYVRTRRRRDAVPVVALVGYTNAGKTTLFNQLTGAGAVASDALFVTLDPLVRRVRLRGSEQILISDTVGFLDRLPHQLVAAFHATLEEVAGADLLLHVIDAAAPDRERRMQAVTTVLREVGADTVPAIDVFNKIDALGPAERRALTERHHDAAFVSARDGVGLEELTDRVMAKLAVDPARIVLELDRASEDDRAVLADLYRHGRVLTLAESRDERVAIEAEVPRRLLNRYVRRPKTA
jgi:GTP-binding protein HflX